MGVWGFSRASFTNLAVFWTFYNEPEKTRIRTQMIDAGRGQSVCEGDLNHHHTFYTSTRFKVLQRSLRFMFVRSSSSRRYQISSVYIVFSATLRYYNPRAWLSCMVFFPLPLTRAPWWEARAGAAAVSAAGWVAGGGLWYCYVYEVLTKETSRLLMRSPRCPPCLHRSQHHTPPGLLF